MEAKITLSEVSRLATEWCKAKHIVVILDDVAKQFATDVANKALSDFIATLREQVAAKKAAKAGAASVAPAPVKSSIVLTDS